LEVSYGDNFKAKSIEIYDVESRKTIEKHVVHLSGQSLNVFLGLDRNPSVVFMTQTSTSVVVKHVHRNGSDYCRQILIPCRLTQPQGHVNLLGIFQNGTSKILNDFPHNSYEGFKFELCDDSVKYFACQSGQESQVFNWSSPKENSTKMFLLRLLKALLTLPQKLIQIFDLENESQTIAPFRNKSFNLTCTGDSTVNIKPISGQWLKYFNASATTKKHALIRHKHPNAETLYTATMEINLSQINFSGYDSDLDSFLEPRLRFECSFKDTRRVNYSISSDSTDTLVFY